MGPNSGNQGACGLLSEVGFSVAPGATPAVSPKGVCPFTHQALGCMGDVAVGCMDPGLPLRLVKASSEIPFCRGQWAREDCEAAQPWGRRGCSHAWAVTGSHLSWPAMLGSSCQTLCVLFCLSSSGPRISATDPPHLAAPWLLGLPQDTGPTWVWCATPSCRVSAVSPSAARCTMCLWPHRYSQVPALARMELPGPSQSQEAGGSGPDPQEGSVVALPRWAEGHGRPRVGHGCAYHPRSLQRREGRASTWLSL